MSEDTSNKDKPLSVVTDPVTEGERLTKLDDKELMSRLLERFQKIQDDWSFLKSELLFDRAPATIPTTEMVDLIVWIREFKSVLEAREKLMNGVLQTRLGSALKVLKSEYDEKGNQDCYVEVKGLLSKGVNYTYVVQRRLDTESLKEEFGEEWLEDHKKPIDFFQAKGRK